LSQLGIFLIPFALYWPSREKQMKLTLQETDALITALQLMNIRDQNNQERVMNVKYADIVKKLEDYRFQMTAF